MALNPKTSVASRNLSLNAALDVLNGGGFLRIYSGTQPTDPDTALSGNTLLIEYALASTAFAAASSGSKVMAAVSSATAGNTGTATFFSLVKSDGTTRVHDGTVGTGTHNLVVSSTTFTSGQTYAGPTLTISQAA